MKNKVFLYAGIALVIGLGAGYMLFNKPSDGDFEAPMARVPNPQGAGISRGQGNGTGGGQGTTGVQPNRGNCLADDCLVVEDLEYPAGELDANIINALDSAINDEYKARAVYVAVMEKFGAVRPFSMIKGAEDQHIASLITLYDKYGLEIPKDTWSSQVTAPATLQEACATGVAAEIENAALYRDQLLPAVAGYEDITGVFTNLMNASQDKHLPAFERCD